MAKHRITQTRFISKVDLLIGRIVVTTKSGKQHSYRYEDLTAAQEDKLRAIAQPLRKRRDAKPTRETRQMNRRPDAILWTAGGEFQGVLNV